MVFDPWIGDIVSIPCLQGRCKRDPGVPGVWRHKTPNPGLKNETRGWNPYTQPKAISSRLSAERGKSLRTWVCGWSDETIKGIAAPLGRGTWLSSSHVIAVRRSFTVSIIQNVLLTTRRQKTLEVFDANPDPQDSRAVRRFHATGN